LRSKESGPKEKKKLRPAEDVMSRILHDSSLNADEFIIGYEDRFEGLQELVIKEFIEVEIPMHRIRYFKRGNEVVWDRKKRLDKIFQ
jgi:poly(A) polymerase